MIFICMNVYGQKTSSLKEIFNQLNDNAFIIDLNKSKSINDSIKLLELYQIDSLSIYYKIDLATINSLKSGESISGSSEIIIFSNSKEKGILFQINSSSSISKSEKHKINISFDIYEQYISPHKILLNSFFEVDKIMDIYWMDTDLPKNLLPGTEYAIQDYNSGFKKSFRCEQNYFYQKFNEIIYNIEKKKPIKLIYELPNWLKKN